MSYHTQKNSPLCCTVLYCQYSTVLYCNVLLSTALYCTVCSVSSRSPLWISLRPKAVVIMNSYNGNFIPEYSLGAATELGKFSPMFSLHQHGDVNQISSRKNG